jgi:hypothetical protein
MNFTADLLISDKAIDHKHDSDKSISGWRLCIEIYHT